MSLNEIMNDVLKFCRNNRKEIIYNRILKNSQKGSIYTLSSISPLEYKVPLYVLTEGRGVYFSKISDTKKKNTNACMWL